MQENCLILNYSSILFKQTIPFVMKMSLQVHIMWCLKDRLSEREMWFYAIFTARKGNYSVISRVKLKTITYTYSSPFGIKKHEPNQKANSLEYATLLLKKTIFYTKIQSLFIFILTVPFTWCTCQPLTRLTCERSLLSRFFNSFICVIKFSKMFHACSMYFSRLLKKLWQLLQLKRCTRLWNCDQKKNKHIQKWNSKVCLNRKLVVYIFLSISTFAESAREK